MNLKSQNSPPRQIWIDGYEANVLQRLGSSQVAFELLKNIESLDKKNIYTIALPANPLPDLPRERTSWRYKILKPKQFWTRIALPLGLYLAKPKPDLVFTPTHYIPRFSPTKRIVTIFDLAYLHFPEVFQKKDLWQLKNWTKYSILHSDHIITISNATKKDIIKYYQVSKDKITVAYPGLNQDIFHPIKDINKIKAVLKKYKIEGDYIIFIGTIQPKKNLIRLFEALLRIENLKLVVVGKTTGLGRQGWLFDEIIKKPKELGIEDRVIFTGFTDTKDLPPLLSGAKAFILPSLWEGFGIPVADAMACGTPTIVSNVSSLPEVVGRAGLLVDPKSVSQIEQAIRFVISDKKLQFSLSKKGLIQAKKFSWKKMAKHIIKVFESV